MFKKEIWNKRTKSLVLVILLLFFFDQALTTGILLNGGKEYNFLFSQWENDLIVFNAIFCLVKTLAVLIVIYILPQIFKPSINIMNENDIRTFALIVFCAWFSFVLCFNLFIGGGI